MSEEKILNENLQEESIENTIEETPAEQLPPKETFQTDDTSFVEETASADETSFSEDVNIEGSEPQSEVNFDELEGFLKPTRFYHEDNYLMYGNKEKTLVDLEGTMKFLHFLGYDGGELRQARKGKASFENYNTEEDNKVKMYCAYCGLEISGIEFERLPDGRLRCNSCSNTIVRGEVQEIFDRVKTNMEAFFGAAINEPIHVEVLEERKLKKKIKTPLSVVDDKSILILGAAVNDKKAGYKIYIENGAPRISVIATFIHELTHIWQYINWDNKKGFKVCPKEKRLLMYEGMAKWVEIQYLYLIGENAVARREEFITRMREDEYGVGFKIYEDAYHLSYKTVICDNNPFVKDGYPVEF